MSYSLFKRLLIALFAMGSVQAADLTWKFGAWSEGDWDHATSNWTPGPTTFTNGDNVSFTVGNQGVTLVGTLRPGHISVSGDGTNRDLWKGTGNIQDPLTGDPCSVTWSGDRKVTGTNTMYNWSGGTTITSTGTLNIGNTALLQVGSNTITIDGGTLNLSDSGIMTLNNNILVTSNHATFGAINGVYTLNGSLTLGGNLTITEHAWGRPQWQGGLVLTKDIVISGGQQHASSFDTQIKGGGSGQYTLTINNNYSFLLGAVADTWDIGGLTKNGSGTLRISAVNILGDQSSLEVSGSDQRITVTAGVIDLTANQLANAVDLNGTLYNTIGQTIGATSSGADIETAFITGTGIITLVAKPLYGTIIRID